MPNDRTRTYAALRELERVSKLRNGSFRRDHVRDAGLSDRAFERLLANGTIKRIHPTTYVFAGTPRSEIWTWASAVDSAHPESFLSGDAGLRLLGIDKFRRSNRDVEVLVLRRHRPRPGIRYVQTRILHREEHMVVRGICVLRLERLLVERAARGASEGELCALIDEGAFAKQLDVPRLRRAIRRHRGRPGNARLRNALDAYLHGEGGAGSGLEDRVGTRILAAVTGRYERNRLRTFAGKRMKPDILLLDVLIAIEIDGTHAHARPTSQRTDRARDAAYRAAGYTPIRIREEHEDEDVDAAIQEIERRQASGTVAARSSRANSGGKRS